MRILLLEDDKPLNDTICDILSSIKGCRVDPFYDGVDASEALTQLYDLFIIDINVPQISGLELLKFIKSSGLQTPTIIISADTNIKTIASAYINGCSDFLKKPFHVEELLFKVKRYCNDLEHIDIGDGFTYDLQKKKLLKGEDTVYMTKKRERYAKSFSGKQRGNCNDADDTKLCL